MTKNAQWIIYRLYKDIDKVIQIIDTLISSIVIHNVILQCVCFILCLYFHDAQFPGDHKGVLKEVPCLHAQRSNGKMVSVYLIQSVLMNQRLYLKGV